MKQVVLSPRTGALEVTEVPVPLVRPGTALVRNVASAVSAGTERLLIDLAGKSLLGKARARPDLVREALNKVRRDGLRTTVREVFLRLDRPHPLGYSSAGVVVDVGAGVSGLRTGDRVACAGAGWAFHAEMIVVSRDLCVPLPPEVSWDAGAFAMLGGIALHGMRRAGVGLGDVVAVIGLGLLGQLTVQLLKSAGCRVVGQDVTPARAALARELGADAVATTPDDARSAAARLSGGAGADAVIITAATSSNAPVELAAELARVRGTIVMVGVTGMRIPRRPYWQKELAFLLSRSLGLGSGDDDANAGPQTGTRYPPEAVRWTAGRNMAAFIGEVARGGVRIEPLITHRFPIERARDAYGLIRGSVREPHLGVVLAYPERDLGGRTQVLRAKAAPPAWGSAARSPAPAAAPAAAGQVTIGAIGGGLFAQTVLLPTLRRVPGVRLRTVATQSGLSARHVGNRLGFERCTTDAREVLDDPEIQAVVVATRHDLHAALAADALRRGKHVFVEKPLALTADETRAVLEAHAAASRVLVVGFNRRYSPLLAALKTFLGRQRPLVFTYRVNAGAIPADHWTYDPREGGGRWLGEGGHFIDVLQYLAGADPVEVFARVATPAGAAGVTLQVSLVLGDGSTASVVYVDGADRAESRERLEVFGAGLAATLEDYRHLSLVRGGRTRRVRRWETARGYEEELRAWVAAVRGEIPEPVPPSAHAANMLCCLGALESARTGRPVVVDVTTVLPPQEG